MKKPERKDISKTYSGLIKEELQQWVLDTKEIRQVYQLASKMMDKK